jgi:hypothetical protein
MPVPNKRLAKSLGKQPVLDANAYFSAGQKQKGSQNK